MRNVIMIIQRCRLQLGIVFTGTCGAVIAVGAHPEWQNPVESAQVLTGIVAYPTDNPFYVYHVKLWTLLNQGAAVLLNGGMSDIHASLLIEGLIGALSFAALFLIAYSISGRTVIALFTPLFMYYFNLVGIDIAYPIRLLGTRGSYGIFGLSYCIFVVGFFGAGWRRTAIFLAGLAPAFHPSLGVFCALVVAIAVFLNRKNLQPELKSLAGYFSAGVLASVASFLWQRHLASHVSGIDPSQAKMYLEAYLQNYDYHRTLSGWTHSGLFLGILVCGVAVVLWRKTGTHSGARFVYAALGASVAVTIVAAFVADVVPGMDFIKILMPWRYMNFVNLCLLPVALGLLDDDSLNMPGLRAIVLFSAIALCTLWRLLPLPHIEYVYAGIVFALFGILTAASRNIADLPFSLALRRYDLIIAAGVVVLVVMSVLPAAISLISREDLGIREIFRFASTRPGMLLNAGDMRLIQVQTRRPILLDSGELDFFCYVPETGPRLNEILRKVYGMDILAAPAEEDKHRGMITRSHQRQWEQRPYEVWKMIQMEFGVMDIFTPSAWNLQLPLVADDGEFRLYAIP